MCRIYSLIDITVSPGEHVYTTYVNYSVCSARTPYSQATLQYTKSFKLAAPLPALITL